MTIRSFPKDQYLRKGGICVHKRGPHYITIPEFCPGDKDSIQPTRESLLLFPTSGKLKGIAYLWVSTSAESN